VRENETSCFWSVHIESRVNLEYYKGKTWTKTYIVRLHFITIQPINYDLDFMWKRELQTQNKDERGHCFLNGSAHTHRHLLINEKTYDTVLRGINKKHKITCSQRRKVIY